MKILLAAILQICSAEPGTKSAEKTQACYNKYIACTLTKDVLSLSSKVEVGALKNLNHCQYKTVR